MSEPRVPAGIESVIRAVTGGSDPAERDLRASTFARGLAIGALVGAAIAGSTIWQRRQAQAADRAGSSRPTTAETDAVDPESPGI